MTAWRYVTAGAVLIVACMAVALLGRAWDWSPFALVLTGAACGATFIGAIALLYLGSDPGDDYTRGYRHGHEDGVEEGTALAYTERPGRDR